MQQRIKAQKVAFITERLDLSPKEAQQFWPIYNAHETEMEMLRHIAREKRHKINVDKLTESEAKVALTEMMAFEREKQRMKYDLVESLLTVISAKKIIALKSAEDAFKKKLFDIIKQRREKMQNMRRKN